MSVDKGYSYFKLLNALQEAGCPICHLAIQTSRHYLDALFYESVLDVPIRLQLMRSFGFCNWHTWQVPSLPVICSPDAGFAIFASDLLRKFIFLTDDLSKRPQKKRTLKYLLGKVKRTLSARMKEAPCPACVYVNEFESYSFKDLLDFIRDGEFLEAYKSSQGICLGHFTALQEKHSRHANFPFLMEVQQRKAQALRDTLEEFIRKLDHRFEHELTSKERGSWKVAMEFLVGKPGVFTNEMGRHLLRQRKDKLSADEIGPARRAFDRLTVRELIDKAQSVKEVALYLRQPLPPDVFEGLKDLASHENHPAIAVVVEDIQDIGHLRSLHGAGFSLFCGLGLCPQTIVFLERHRGYLLEDLPPREGRRILRPLKDPEDLYLRLLWHRFGLAVLLSGRIKEKDMMSGLLCLVIEGERELWCRLKDSTTTDALEPGAIVQVFGWEKWLTNVIEVLDARVLGR